ncbi:DUF429 domain-containing protein [Paenibacillus dauci]|uniref:DUF429 domain-containing protein n=1 Tax=Paenibacillus dauci TaxID=1567106 RepID=UPI000619067C|nr:DUF429 domain-containing protein [Paenibacillus dauci]
MIIIGIDCATEHKNTGICVYDYNNKKFIAYKAASTTMDTINSILKDHSKENFLLCWDTPLGWPIDFSSSLVNHLAGQYLRSAPLNFFNRSTDLFCHSLLGKKPLEITTNRIARTTHKTLGIINELQMKYPKMKLLWDPKEEFEIGYIEVYPVTWLLSESIVPNKTKQYDSYKGTEQKNQRRRLDIIKELRKRGMKFNGMYKRMIKEEHFFDACLCCLGGKDFLDDRTIRPINNISSIQKEGWIWIKPIV